MWHIRFQRLSQKNERTGRREVEVCCLVCCICLILALKGSIHFLLGFFICFGEGFIDLGLEGELVACFLNNPERQELPFSLLHSGTQLPSGVPPAGSSVCAVTLAASHICPLQQAAACGPYKARNACVPSKVLLV